MASTDRQKIVIDTDCGVDDALAMLLAFSSKDIAEILAVTCCFGNTSLDNVCSNVMRVLTVCDEKIPIHRGCRGPLLLPNTLRAICHGEDGLGGCASEFSTGGLKESEIPAAVALINLAKKHPKQITVIAIGPLTNVAIAHRLDPKFTENLKSLVIMGGNYKGIGNKTEVAEFNFLCDPEAADIILSEADCPVVLVPWETTIDYGVAWDVYKELIEINTPKGNFFKKITEFPAKRGLDKGKKQLFDCDLLAVAALLYPQSVTRSFKSLLRVECEGKLTRGLVVLLRETTSNSSDRKVEIVTDYNMEYLNKLLRQMLS